MTGAHAEHVIAFARTLKRRRLVVAIGRHFAPLTDGGRQWPSQWDGALEPETKGTYEYLIGGEAGRRTNTLSLAELFRDLPVCVVRVCSVGIGALAPCPPPICNGAELPGGLRCAQPPYFFR